LQLTTNKFGKVHCRSITKIASATTNVIWPIDQYLRLQQVNVSGL